LRQSLIMLLMPLLIPTSITQLYITLSTIFEKLNLLSAILTRHRNPARSNRGFKKKNPTNAINKIIALAPIVGVIVTGMIF